MDLNTGIQPGEFAKEFPKMPEPKYEGTVQGGRGRTLHWGNSLLGTYCGKQWKKGNVERIETPFFLIHSAGNCRFCVNFAKGKSMPGPQGLRDLMRL